MLHKRYIFVSLLAPSFSFASTATDSLANATRDVFDNLNENPAFVNVEGGKDYLRIGKDGTAQFLTDVSGFGLGVQANTLKSMLVKPLVGNDKEISDASAALMAASLPFQLSLGGISGDIKWGASLKYHNASVTGESSATTFDPSFMKMGLNLGVIMGENEGSFGYTRDSWKVATIGKTKTATVDTSTPLPDGESEQTTDAMGFLFRRKMGEHKMFVSAGQSKTKAKFWASVTSSTSSQDDLSKAQNFYLGTEREHKLGEGLVMFCKHWINWNKTTENSSQKKRETTDMALNTAHGLEYSAASWATLRAGVKAAVYGNTKVVNTSYTEANQGGTAVANSITSQYVLRGIGVAGTGVAPTMGVGLKFGTYAIDATLAQDGTDSMGFSDKILGKVELTAQF